LSSKTSIRKKTRLPRGYWNYSVKTGSSCLHSPFVLLFPPLLPFTEYLIEPGSALGTSCLLSRILTVKVLFLLCPREK
jgi:hypothetical protein